VLLLPAIMHKHHFYVMEIWIKTLTGASLQLLVSPYDSVYNLKFRIQKLEGGHFYVVCIQLSSFYRIINSFAAVVHLTL